MIAGVRTQPQNGVLDIKLFIDGAYVDALSGKTFESRNPATNEVIAHVAEAGSADVDRAAKAARRAFEDGRWSKRKVGERVAILKRFADGIRRNLRDLAELETLDTGKPIRESFGFDVPRAAQNIEYFAEAIAHAGTEAYPVDGDFLNYVLRQPVGVAGCISPWNLPLLLLTWKLGPALACGNSVVCKPAEFTPITASMLGTIANEAGIPPGVLNIVQGYGPDAAGSAITAHPEIDILSFTGDSKTGRVIMRAASETLKDVSFELGGKGAGVVFADCDLEKAVEQLIRATFQNQGEVCLAAPRLLIERPIFAEFCERFEHAARALRFGDPLDSSTTIGALIDREHLDRVSEFVASAPSEGAQLLFGGERPALDDAFASGHFLEPTAFVGVHPTMRICQEEVFGPVVTLAPFDGEDEVIDIVNGTRYGLAATIWTRDLARAHRVAARVRTGLTWINCWYVRDLRTPFGGMHESGIGREGGIRSLDFYSEIKNVCLAL